MSVVLITDSQGPAISLEDVKDHLRITEDDRDSDLLLLIYAAENHIENYLGRSLINKGYRLKLDCFKQTIEIPKPPLVSVESIKYIDSDGNQQTVTASDYIVDADATPGRVVPAYGLSWPSARSIINAVEIEYTAGYGTTPDDIPDAIKHALKLLIGHFNENTEQTTVVSMSDISFGVESLCAPYRITPI